MEDPRWEEWQKRLQLAFLNVICRFWLHGYEEHVLVEERGGGGDRGGGGGGGGGVKRGGGGGGGGGGGSGGFGYAHEGVAFDAAAFIACGANDEQRLFRRSLVQTQAFHGCLERPAAELRIFECVAMHVAMCPGAGTEVALPASVGGDFDRCELGYLKVVLGGGGGGGAGGSGGGGGGGGSGGSGGSGGVSLKGSGAGAVPQPPPPPPQAFPVLNEKVVRMRARRARQWTVGALATALGREESDVAALVADAHTRGRTRSVANPEQPT
jgi:hypothetical protein